MIKALFITIMLIIYLLIIYLSIKGYKFRFEEQNNMKDRLKEIKKEIYLETVKIKESKKRIKELHQESNQILGEKKLEKIKK